VVPGGAGNSGLSPSSITIAPNGKFAYVSYLDPAGTGHVSEFSVNPTNGKLVVPAVQYSDGLHPSDLAMSRDGKLLYVANSGSNRSPVFQSDSATGALRRATRAATGLEPNAVVVTDHHRIAPPQHLVSRRPELDRSGRRVFGDAVARVRHSGSPRRTGP